MFDQLDQINARPQPFEFYTARGLWTDEHTSEQMLALHLDERLDVASRNAAFIDRSVEWIAAHFGVGPRTRIADFGCGPGLYTMRLARRGAVVTGIDFSEQSIQHARDVAEREGLAIRYLHQDYLEGPIAGEFDLVLLVMCDYCALSPAQRRQLLGTFRELLRPGGAVLLDVYSLAAYDQREERTEYGPNLLDGFWSPGPYYGFLNTLKYDAERIVLDKYTIVEPERTRTVYNWLHYFSPELLATELADRGLAVAERHADVAGSPYDAESSEFAVVVRQA